MSVILDFSPSRVASMRRPARNQRSRLTFEAANTRSGRAANAWFSHWMYRYATRTSQQMTVLCQTPDSPEPAPATPSPLLPPGNISNVGNVGDTDTVRRPVGRCAIRTATACRPPVRHADQRGADQHGQSDQPPTSMWPLNVLRSFLLWKRPRRGSPSSRSQSYDVHGWQGGF